jgi:hypothetical protein
MSDAMVEYHCATAQLFKYLFNNYRIPAEIFPTGQKNLG